MLKSLIGDDSDTLNGRSTRTREDSVPADGDVSLQAKVLADLINFHRKI